MNYLQLDDIKLFKKYSPLQSIVTMKPGLEVIQDYWKWYTLRISATTTIQSQFDYSDYTISGC